MESIGESCNHDYDKMKNYFSVIQTIKKLEKSNMPLIVAIEGRCCSGKSSLALQIKKVFNCNIFHMDDFFLPFEMKTKERLLKPGGNVHYERFNEEILIPLQKNETVIYRPYNCSKGELDKAIYITPKKLTIVEGSYSMHPTLQQAYAYKIFLNVDPQVQLQRILNRNGEKMLNNFVTKWIPLEENYFSTLNIKNKCDTIIDTSDF